MYASRDLRDLMTSTAKLERKRPRRKRTNKLVVIAVVLALLYAFANQELRLWSVRAQERRIEDEIRAQEIKSQILKEQIKALQTDEYIEKVAREQLGWIKKGEIQYLPEQRH
ncbi:MAG: septum formation initiator family protein [Firmicutes bacterium]|nr:septum formation initiator family protein [Bacillota bacterium]